MRALVFIVCLGACSDDSAVDLAVIDAAVPPSDLVDVDRLISATDQDGDGLDDATEAQLATAYLPFLSIAANDACPTNGLVVRVTPADGTRVWLRYAWLFDRDCDVGYAGVDGSMAILIDPNKPSPSGIISLRVVSRPDSFCQNISTCGQCTGQLTCDMLDGKPAVWAAVDRHAIYATRSLSCMQTGACLATCSDATTPAMPMIVNVGEPNVPLVHDLTDAGLITTANGWQSQALFHYDPFGGLAFGDAPALTTLLSGQDGPTCNL